MKIIVTGGRHYTNPDHVFDVLDELQPTHVVHGDCLTGVDSFATIWCRQNGIPYTGYPAHWIKYERAAGPIRNGIMVNNADAELVVAFPGNKGTNDCVKQAKAFDLEVLDLRDETEYISRK